MSIAPDRHERRRSKSRDAILHSALTITADRGSQSFTFDELAAHADVSRRTVFNHFPTRESLTIAMCAEVLADISARVAHVTASAPLGNLTRTDFFAAIEVSLTTVDIPEVIDLIGQIVGPEICRERHDLVLTMALAEVGDTIRSEARRRLPAVDDFEIDLISSAILHGVSIASEHWLRQSESAGANPREVWNDLTSRLLQSIQNGYLR